MTNRARWQNKQTNRVVSLFELVAVPSLSVSLSAKVNQPGPTCSHFLSSLVVVVVVIGITVVVVVGQQFSCLAATRRRPTSVCGRQLRALPFSRTPRASLNKLASIAQPRQPHHELTWIANENNQPVRVTVLSSFLSVCLSACLFVCTAGADHIAPNDLHLSIALMFFPSESSRLFSSPALERMLFVVVVLM